MAKFLDKTQVQTPVLRFRDFDLSCQHLTTAFFMRPTVTYAKEFPKSKIKCNLKSYARMQPLLKPVLGSVQVHNRAFFVPFRTVWQLWDSMLTGSPYNTPEGTVVVTGVPTVSNALLADFFANTDNGLSSLVGVIGSNTAYDFVYAPAGTAVGFYKFTPFGRHIMKVLNQLGYKVCFGNASSDGTKVGFAPGDTFSLLPLLCFCKIFLDWYYPAQYAHSGAAAFVDGLFQRNFRYSWNLEEGNEGATYLKELFDFIAWAYYGNDYFTAAFDTPTAPAVGYDVGMTIPDISAVFNTNSSNLPRQGFVDISSSFVPGSNSAVHSYTPAVHLPYIASGSTSASVFTQYLDDALKKLTNWQRRHQLVGARVLDRYLADFGVIPVWEKLKRSMFIGSQSFPVQFQDVMSNSDTIQSNGDVVSGAQLGAYAGKGVAYDGQGNFEFSVEEFGYFIIVNTVVPDIAYYEGLDRNVLHKFPMDFLNGQWESLGTQPLSAAELSFGLNVGAGNVDRIFGFLPRYAEYKVGRDMITGLFNYNSVNQGLLSWSTARRVNADDVHGIDFLRGDDAWQYARIFYGDVTGSDSELDKFIFVHRINLKASIEARPLYDVYDFDEPEGDKIQMQVNGAQL